MTKVETSAKIQKNAIKEKIQNLAANNIVAIVANLCSAAFIRGTPAHHLSALYHRQGAIHFFIP